MRNSKYFLFFIVFLFSTQLIFSQKGFRFFDSKQKYQDVDFKLINNLIVIPIEINGKSLNFIFDTGVNKTIVFNSANTDTIFFRRKEKFQLRGLGTGEPVEAILSKNNRFRMQELISTNHSVYIILRDEFDLSAKMGITIHGVIGYDILKSLVVHLNYRKKRMRLFNPDYFEMKKCKKCEIFPLTIFQNKPYIDVDVAVEDQSDRTSVKMLIDSGGSDALWLFEHSKPSLVTPEKFFNDFLGVGLSGVIYGKRSRIRELKMGRFEIVEPTVSFLDSISTKNARRFRARNGSIGNNILKRFKVWIDYANNQVMLEKNGSFKGGFEYNMSGIEVVYNGKVLVEEKQTKIGEVYGRDANTSATASSSVSIVTNYVYRFKSSYKVDEVLPDSPAYLAGVRPDDVLYKINGKSAHNYKFTEIIGLFQKKPNMKIKLVVIRNNQFLTFEFRLRKIV